MNIVVVGHVDHGKSTIIGRLLAETKSLPEGKLEQVKLNCERNSKPFEYAFLLDALKDEQAQGITIDSARVFFHTDKRNYIIIDAPGHIEFLKNMISGAARAEAAFLVIDAAEGVQENSRRHGYMLAMLGIKQVAILVNKMDLVDYQEAIFLNIRKEYEDFLAQIDIHAKNFIPVSGREGDNLAETSEKMPWYQGQTALKVLDSFEKEKPALDKPFRMPVQDVYKFTAKGDNRRIVAGTVDSGKISVGDEVVFYPSGKKSHVKSIEGFACSPQDRTSAGYAMGFTLEEQIYITRGEIAAKTSEAQPENTSHLLVSLFWLGKKPLSKKKNYFLKLGTAKVTARLEEVHRVINASDLSSSDQQEKIQRHEVAECTLKLNQTIAFDKAEELAATSRFVIIDEYEICGGGIIRKGLKDKQSIIRDQVFLRNYKWEKSIISRENRSEKYNQRPTLILITGQKNVGKKSLAKSLESRLFADGKLVYFLGIGNVVYGIDADLKKNKEETQAKRQEHLRRLSEVAHILLDAGMILIVTAVELSQDDLSMIKISIDSEQIETVWVGDNVTTNLNYDIQVPSHDDSREVVEKLKEMLQERGIIFRP